MMKCSDFFVIRIRWYASTYYMNKMDPRNGEKAHSIGHKKFLEASENYWNFFWKFFTHVTGVTKKDFQIDYFLGSRESATEELNDGKGIFIANNTPYYTYYIPVEKVELINWIKENIGNLPHKVLKKSYISNIEYWLSLKVNLHRKINKTAPEIRERLLKNKIHD